MKKYLNLGIGLILGLAISLFGISMYVSAPKTAFIHTEQVFTRFEQTKDLEAKLTALKNQRTHSLDSLQMGIREKYHAMGGAATNEQELEAFEKMQEEYLAREQHILQENEQLTQAYNAQIWKQLNQYIQEFGEQEGYQYIYGASGEGNLMYARSSENITEEVLQYVNDRYQGNR